MAQNGLYPVSFARHGQRFWRRFTSYKFASHRTDCAIVLHEVSQIAAAFPIVFRETERGMEPHALLSLTEETDTPFVSQDGRWLAVYVPSALRCHPFQASATEGRNAHGCSNFQLLVDESSGLVSTNPDDVPFFDSKNEPSAELLKVASFLQARFRARTATLELCQLIGQMGLFEPLSSHKKTLLPPGTLGVAPSRLNDLSRDQKLQLAESDALWLIHAHQISLSHIEWLSKIQNQWRQQVKHQKYTENSDFSDFLDAIANAQNGANFGICGV